LDLPGGDHAVWKPKGGWKPTVLTKPLFLHIPNAPHNPKLIVQLPKSMEAPAQTWADQLTEQERAAADRRVGKRMAEKKRAKLLKASEPETELLGCFNRLVTRMPMGYKWLEDKPTKPQAFPWGPIPPMRSVYKEIKIIRTEEAVPVWEEEEEEEKEKSLLSSYIKEMKEENKAMIKQIQETTNRVAVEGDADVQYETVPVKAIRAKEEGKKKDSTGPAAEPVSFINPWTGKDRDLSGRVPTPDDVFQMPQVG